MTESEFTALDATLRAKLTALASGFCRSARLGQEAEDIVQEAMVVLWALSDKGYTINNAEALAVRITKNICINHYRKRHLEFAPIEGHLDAGETEDACGYEYEDIKAFLLNQLTPTQRKLLHLKEDEGLSLDQISEKTNKPKTSVKSTISAAKRHLKDLLKNM